MMSTRENCSEPTERQQAEKLLGAVFRRFLFGLQTVDILRNLAHEAFPQTQDIALSQAAKALDWAISNEDYKLFEGLWTPEQQQELAMAIAQASLLKYVGGIKAACLVFWHSILDSIALDLCKITVLVVPERWDSEIGQRKVTLDKLRDANYEEIRARVLEKRLGELERESLLNKLEVLCQVGEISAGQNMGAYYAYDLKRLRRVNGLRHEIVHGNGLAGAAELDSTDVDYLRDTAVNFLMTLAKQLKLQTTMSDVFGTQAEGLMLHGSSLLPLPKNTIPK